MWELAVDDVNNCTSVWASAVATVAKEGLRLLMESAAFDYYSLISITTVKNSGYWLTFKIQVPGSVTFETKVVAVPNDEIIELLSRKKAL